MVRITMKVDQIVRVGSDITLTPTDIDGTGARLRARGRVMGGPLDGDPFDSTHEMLPGAAVHFGPHVVVTLVEVVGDRARFGIFSPTGVVVTQDK